MMSEFSEDIVVMKIYLVQYKKIEQCSKDYYHAKIIY